MNELERHWYLILSVGIGMIAYWLIFLRPRSPEDGDSGGAFLMFGPFGKYVDRYMNKRGGLTAREKLGWGVVILVVVVAIIFAPGT